MILEELLSSYNVKLIIGELPETKTFFAAPFCSYLGIDIKNKLIYSKIFNYNIIDIVHELSHILFGVEEEEWNWLGWEYLICKKLNIEDSIWRQQEYCINWKNKYWVEDLSNEEFEEFKKEIIETAKKYEYIK